MAEGLTWCLEEKLSVICRACWAQMLSTRGCPAQPARPQAAEPTEPTALQPGAAAHQPEAAEHTEVAAALATELAGREAQLPTPASTGHRGQVKSNVWRGEEGRRGGLGGSPEGVVE